MKGVCIKTQLSIEFFILLITNGAQNIMYLVFGNYKKSEIISVLRGIIIFVCVVALFEFLLTKAVLKPEVIGPCKDFIRQNWAKEKQ